MSSPVAPGTLKQLWFKWKALRLPWRKTFLVGSDLAGNTFWEFRDALQAGRWRRIVRYGKAPHYADVKISPQWHSWLRHTRPVPPTIQEQQYEVSRQAMMKQLAHQADERWKSVPSYLDGPARAQPGPPNAITDSKPEMAGKEMEGSEGMRSAVGDQAEVEEAIQPAQEQETQRKGRREREENPWNKPQTGAPSEKWQPESWSPGVARRR